MKKKVRGKFVQLHRKKKQSDVIVTEKLEIQMLHKKRLKKL